MKKNSICISVLLFLTITSFAQNTAKIVLNKGQKFIQETNGDVVISQEVMGQPVESKIEIKSATTIEVKNVNDTGYSLTYTVTKMKMNMSAMGQNMAYDSDKQDNDSTISKSMDKMLNNPQNFEIDKMGKVVSKTEDENKELTGNDMMAGLQNILGVSDAFQAIPLKAKTGYNWIDSVNKEGTRSNMAYTIKDLKGNDATVSVKGTVQMSQKAEAQNMEFTNNSTGTLNGELIIDMKTGIIKQRNTTVETTGTMDIMGQQIPMATKIISETIIKNAN